MSFNKKYGEIKELIREDFIFLEKGIESLFQDKNPLNEQLLEFLSAPSKRLRPLVGFLFLRCYFEKLTKPQLDVQLAVELIHNATLIHDDVIDNSKKRRNLETFNAKFDNDLAVVAGDFLLSLALEKIIATSSIEVLEVFTNALKLTCIGEINQYFSKFKITSIEDYIEKSKNKTALLFQTGILGGLLLSKEKENPKFKKTAIDFAQNFGIAFQIRDDLINLSGSDDLKPDLNDFNSGIYTAPLIFASIENPKIFESENILEELKNIGAIEKTKILMDNYFDKSIFALKDCQENIYKKGLVDLVNLLKESACK